MKLRIKGNSIRLRLTQTEVARLSHGETITEKTQFSPMDVLEYVVQTWHLNVTETKFGDNKLIVFLPEEGVRGWSASEQVSIEAVQDNGEEGLRILVEKDFACLAEREGEDESDNYLHPKSGETKC